MHEISLDIAYTKVEQSEQIDTNAFYLEYLEYCKDNNIKPLTLGHWQYYVR